MIPRAQPPRLQAGLLELPTGQHLLFHQGTLVAVQMGGFVYIAQDVARAAQRLVNQTFPIDDYAQLRTSVAHITFIAGQCLSQAGLLMCLDSHQDEVSQ